MSCAWGKRGKLPATGQHMGGWLLLLAAARQNSCHGWCILRWQMPKVYQAGAVSADLR